MSEKKITPVMKQYLNIKEQHPDKYVLFRMGDFYELFYDDAVTAAKILQITLTKRGGTPMCGIPFHQLDNYLYKITTAGKKAAIVEQMEDPSKTKGLVKRDVVRIVTPGTINDNKVLDTKSNNYLLSLNYKEKQGIFFLVVAAMDISTGEAEIVKKKCPDLKGEIDNFINIYTPREIIIPEYLNEPSVLNTVFYKTDNFIINPLPDYIYKKEYCTLKIKNHFHLQSLKGISLENDPLAAGTFYALLHYGRETQKNKLNYLKIPRIINSDSYMLLDSATQKNLEILRNLQDNSSQNTLVSVMDRTVTAMGGRLLKRILLKPLLQKKKIMERQELVDFFFRNYEHRKKVHGLLKEINDFERLCSKLALGRILPKEMISLKNSLQNALELNSYLQKINLTSLVYRQTDALRNITANISATMLAEPSNTVTEGGMIQPAADTKLTQYHKILSEGKQWLAALQKDESTKTGINNLKIKYNDNIGYFLEVSKANVKLVPDYFIKKQTLVNCDRFTTEKLASYQDKLLEAEDNVNNLEYEIFNRVKTECAAHINKIQGLSEKCAYTDVMTSFSNTAAAQKYIRPEIRNDHLINIENGRHPVIENNIDSNFVPNSLKIGTADNLVHIITGPNMSGKSTYLRQNAIIVLLAQTGSFVPAQKADIGICDRIFTRVGASDNLARGESTFLVEMHETANILNNATPGSLIIMDEIGRGTSTYDGMSIAWAIIEYITENKKCQAKTLFATHYHELTALNEKKAVENYTVTVMDKGNEVVFLKKVVKGSADKSYGVHVAELAGLPREVTDRAHQKLKELEQSGSVKNKPDKKPAAEQLFFPVNRDSEIISLLKKFDLNNSTPVDALNFIKKLKNEFSDNQNK